MAARARAKATKIVTPRAVRARATKTAKATRMENRPTTNRPMAMRVKQPARVMRMERASTVGGMENSLMATRLRLMGMQEIQTGTRVVTTTTMGKGTGTAKMKTAKTRTAKAKAKTGRAKTGTAKMRTTKAETKTRTATIARWAVTTVITTRATTTRGPMEWPTSQIRGLGHLVTPPPTPGQSASVRTTQPGMQRLPTRKKASSPQLQSKAFCAR